MPTKPLVLVTGGTGFLAKWLIVYLFREDYRVRTTVRNISRVNEINSSLREAGIPEEQISSLEVVQADLLKDDGWTGAVKDATYVLHAASPFPSQPPSDENDLIIPARDGTLRVLRAARDAGCVSRVVITSSFAAIGYGHPYERANKGTFTEKDWSDINSTRIQPYHKSKTIAERAAWDFMKTECSNSKLELTVVNPVGIFGPVLGPEDGTSLRLIGGLLDGSIPALPRIHSGFVDVRDCVDMHLRAMTNPKAKGERFLCIGEGSLWFEEAAEILRKNLGPRAKKVPTFILPNLLVRGLAFFTPTARLIANDLDCEKVLINAKAKEVLGWQWQYTNEEAIMASADSLIKFGMVKL